MSSEELSLSKIILEAGKNGNAHPSGKAERKRHKVTSFEKLNKVTALLLPGQDSSHKILQGIVSRP